MEKKNFNIVVEEAIHIPLISARLTELANEGLGGFVLLNHQEGPCIIRGNRQGFEGEYESEKKYHILNGIPEIRRKDGGWAWYHQNDISKCLNQYGKLHSRDTDYLNNYWNSVLITLSSKLGSKIHAIEGKPDLYKSSSGLLQVLGTSMTADVIRRACFYEGNKDFVDSQLTKILEKDLLHVPNINHFLASYRPFPSETSKKLIDILDLGDEISSGEFIQGFDVDETYMLQLPREGDYSKQRGSCIGKEYLNHRK